MNPKSVIVTKAGSIFNGVTFVVARETKAGGVVVSTPAGFRTYQAGEFTRV